MQTTAQPSAWERELSHERLAFRDGDAIARKPWKDAPWRPAALMPVARGAGAAGAAVALTVESMPKVTGYSSFGVGRAMAKVGERFGDFGRRADRDDKELGPEIKQGSRLALRLSQRGAEGTRTARFYVDQRQVAVFADIEDDGGDSDSFGIARPTPNESKSVKMGSASTTAAAAKPSAPPPRGTATSAAGYQGCPLHAFVAVAPPSPKVRDGVGVDPFERLAPKDHLPHDHTEAINVSTQRILFTAQDLRRHPRRRS
eukprot:COSAG04_NODE_1859_length_5375_cov_2.368082_2_plen_258_part_00